MRPRWGSWVLCGPSQSCGPQKKVIERPGHYYSINQYQRQTIICLFSTFVQKSPRRGSSDAEVKAFLSRTTWLVIARLPESDYSGSVKQFLGTGTSPTTWKHDRQKAIQEAVWWAERPIMMRLRTTLSAQVQKFDVAIIVYLN